MQKLIKPQAKIIGTGSYLPSKVLTNADLEKIVETSDEWIVTRTGMKERRVAAPEEYSSEMGKKAAEKALKAANLTAEDIDFILFATITPDYLFPSTACLAQKMLGAHKAAALDVQAACSGYLYALGIAKSFIESCAYRNILIIASEKLSSIVNYQDRNTCILFGDGASAAVVSSHGKGLLVRDVTLGADGELAELIMVPAGGSRLPASQATVENRQHFLHMEGKEVFKHAVRRMEAASKASIEKAGLLESDIAWIVPHQANIRILEALAKRFNVPMEKVFVTIHKYGNTSASSIGIALDELMQTESVKNQENILLTAFGAGLTWGAAVVTYE